MFFVCQTDTLCTVYSRYRKIGKGFFDVLIYFILFCFFAGEGRGVLITGGNFAGFVIRGLSVNEIWGPYMYFQGVEGLLSSSVH